MKVAYFDCFSGISGDMVLGSLVDAGCKLDDIESELRRLPLTGWNISAKKVVRKGLAATHVIVESSETHHHRSLTKILQLIEAAGFSHRVSERASNILRRLGEAESRVHNVAVDKVHFHEVGAVDAIMDIVGAAAGFELMGIETFACSALNVGAGTVTTEHGLLPVPAPASADLLRGVPTYSTGIQRELVTPTGAAIIATLSSHFGGQLPMKTQTIGYGAGSAELSEQANVLRILVGDSATVEAGASELESVVVLEANIDDMSPQIYGYFSQRALALGALDVFSTAVQMKKDRPGQLITVLCEPAAAEKLSALFFQETTTLGVRRSNVTRQTLQRECVRVQTSLGSIRIKIGRLDGRTLSASPEYEDCKRIATEHSMPLKQVLSEAMIEFHRNGGADK